MRKVKRWFENVGTSRRIIRRERKVEEEEGYGGEAVGAW